MNKKNIILFTAAGFSIDFLEPITKSNYKLTTQFINDVITDYNFFRNNIFNSIKEKFVFGLDEESYLKECESIINKYSKLFCIAKKELNIEDGNSLNFEHLIYLSELISDTKEGELKGNIFIEYKLKPIVLTNKLGDLEFTLNETLKIKALILNVIYAYFKLRENESKLLANYFEKLCSVYNVKYHTLNYDLVLEDSINGKLKDFINPNDFYFYNHLHGQINLVNAKVLIDKGVAFSQRAGILSPINTNYKINNIGIGNFDSDENRHDFDMITGLDKSTKMLNDHYTKAQHRFVLDYYASNEIIIIGYSFNDKHINNILRANIRNYKKVIIVDYLMQEKRNNFEIQNKIYHFFLQIWNYYPMVNDLVDYKKVENSFCNLNNFCDSVEGVEFEFHFKGAVEYFKNVVDK